VHLSLRGAIAISLRRAHGAFPAPEVVDEHPASPPAVAIGPAGRGIVAWLRDRRVWAVSFDAEAGTVGRVKALTGAGSYRDVRAAAGGEGGAATVAFIVRRSGRFAIAALRRGGHGAFPRRAQTIAGLDRRAFIADLALAADEEGQTTLAWSAEHFGRPQEGGVNGVTSGVAAAVASPGLPRFGRPLTVARRGRLLCDTPSVASASRRAVVAFSCHDRTRWRVRAAVVGAQDAGPSQTALTSTLSANVSLQTPPLTAGIDTTGTWTVIAARPDPPDTRAPGAPMVERVLAVTGR
jgi:hypothetical protein